MIGTALQVIAYLGKYASDTKKKFEVSEKKEKRSLSANAYYWVLCGKVAQKTRVSTARIHNENLRALSVPERMGDKIVTVVLPDTDEAEEQVLESETYHLRPTSQVREGRNGIMYRTYIMLRGSHTFCVEDMSALIDLIVQEAEAQGIETITPEEKRKMMERYGVQIQKSKGNGHIAEGEGNGLGA